MFIPAIESITKSIFPIFFELKDQGLTKIGVTGTGFFVEENGLFITAHHVIKSIPENARTLYCGNVPDSILTTPLDIEEVYCDPIKDLYIGRIITEHALPKLQIAANEPKVGQSLCLCGYPLAQLSNGVGGSIDVSNVRKYWQPTFMIDGMRGVIDNRNYVGFITQHTSLRGMSGGPVFGVDGQVYGMDVAVIGREIPDVSTPMTIHNGMAVGVGYIKEAISKAQKRGVIDK